MSGDLYFLVSDNTARIFIQVFVLCSEYVFLNYEICVHACTVQDLLWIKIFVALATDLRLRVMVGVEGTLS
jgi:hypothetical protein